LLTSEETFSGASGRTLFAFDHGNALARGLCVAPQPERITAAAHKMTQADFGDMHDVSCIELEPIDDTRTACGDASVASSKTLAVSGDAVCAPEWGDSARTFSKMLGAVCILKERISGR
jgi:hypothetical protein